MIEAFYWACKNGDLETVKLLLNDPRVDPSVSDKHGKILIYLEFTHFHRKNSNHTGLSEWPP